VALGPWIGEINNRLGVVLKFKLKKVLHEKKSRNFSIVVAETEPLGRMLLLGENSNMTIQTAEKYDFYDEMLAHIPMSAHPNPRHILIIGGGDGVILREVLKYDTVEKVVVAEIDRFVIEASKNHLRLDNGAFDDPRVEIVIGDAAKYVERADSKFDIIIGDYSDPYEDTVAGSLISQEFYLNIKRIMRPESIAVFQAGSPLFQSEIFKKMYIRLLHIFRIVKPFWTVVPYYPGALWVFLAVSDKVDPSKPIRNPPSNTIFYNSEIHRTAFVLPQIIRMLLN